MEAELLELRREVARIKAQLAWIVAILTMGGVCLGFWVGLSAIRAAAREVTCDATSDGDIACHTLSGPIVLTHVTARGDRLLVAPLATPRTIVDSESVTIPATEWRALAWQSEGGPVDAPSVGKASGALFTRLEISKW